MPAIYLAALGGVQLLLLWTYRSRFGLVIPIVGSVLIIALLVLLLRTHRLWQWKMVLLCLLIAVATLGPSLVAVEQRQQAGLTFESDSMAMDEVAVDRVLHGHAIYGTDWSGTQVDGYAYEYGGIDLHYYAHFPLMVLAAVPVRIGADLLDVPFDYRFVVIAFSLLALLAILRLPSLPSSRFQVAIAILMNPAISLAGWTGHDDVCYVAMLLMGLAFLARRHLLFASLSIGVAAALKPFALLMLPFVLAALWLTPTMQRRVRLRQVSIALAIFSLPMVVSTGPFLLADPGAFYRDIVAFPTEILPMGGLGFTALLVFLRAVPVDARFPLAPFELAAMVPALWFGMRAFGRGRTLGHLLFGYTLTLFAFLFFARYFADNYLAVIVGLMLCIPALISIPLPPANAAHASHNGDRDQRLKAA